MTLAPAHRRDLQALVVWFAALAVTWTVLLTMSALAGDGLDPMALASRWARWDFIHFSDIARLGYLPAPGTASTAAPLTAFFPAFPELLAAGRLIGLPVTATGLVVSALAGAVATVFIARLGELRRPGSGVIVAAVFVFSPMSIFLFAPYTEALFLAFAIPAWYLATRNRWLPASLLAAGAGLTRISGVFLVIALFVLWCTQTYRTRTPLRKAIPRVAWLAVPTLAVLGWMLVLFLMTGEPLEYLHAQQYWGRSFTDPISAIVTTWTGYVPSPEHWMRGAEIAAFLVGVFTLVLMLLRRRFGEATWLGINVAALGTSTYLYSVPRSGLLWWPLWLEIGALLERRRWMLWIWFPLSAAAMVIWDYTFFSGQWAG